MLQIAPDRRIESMEKVIHILDQEIATLGS
jgi:hypothetical protein